VIMGTSSGGQRVSCARIDYDKTRARPASGVAHVTDEVKNLLGGAVARLPSPERLTALRADVRRWAEERNSSAAHHARQVLACAGHRL
jgi:hypothetical protein